MRIIFTIAWVVVLAAGGCSPRAYSPAIRHGAVFSAASIDWNRLELPSLALRASAVGFVNLNGQPTLRVAATIGQAGLQFHGPTKAAHLAIHIRATGAGDATFIDTLALANRAFRPSYPYGIRLQVPPGRYKVWVKVTDLATGTHVEHTAHAAVPSPRSTRLGSVRAEAKGSAGWHPLAGYDVAGRIDSLRFTVRAARDSGSAASSAIRAYLMRFRADSSVSTLVYRMDDPRYRLSSLVYKGIDYEDSTVIRADHRTLNSAGQVQIRFQFKAPPKGNYRFEVQAAGKMRARDFAMRSPDFPEVRTPRELAAPLAGLMKPSRYRKLMKISDPDSLQAAVTHFWRAQMDGQQAFLVAAMYYRRVRQANRLFTNYKEGWKTDRGMFYILFGPPSGVIRTPPSLQERYARGLEHLSGLYKGWSYDYINCLYDIFVQVRPYSDSFPFQHFMVIGLAGHLLFGKDHFSKYKEAQQQWWWSGRILHRKFPHWEIVPTR
jgi:GWxTD domain-containing protein